MDLRSSLIESHWCFTHQLYRSLHLPSRGAQQSPAARTPQFFARNEYTPCSCASISGRISSHRLPSTHPKAHNNDQDVVRQAARAPNWRSHTWCDYMITWGHVPLNLTTRRNLICRALFWSFVAYLACATHMKPQVTFICGVRLCAPLIGVISVAHPITCATHSVCGAPRFGAPRIGCATDIKNGAPQICFPFYFFRKYSKNTQYTIENIQYIAEMQRYTSLT
jgi:hypothetical protein